MGVAGEASAVAGAAASRAVAVHKGALIVTPVRRVRGGHDLRDLVRRVPKGYKPGELHWGSPVGREVWMHLLSDSLFRGSHVNGSVDDA